jgi:hypothetical protein
MSLLTLISTSRSASPIPVHYHKYDNGYLLFRDDPASYESTIRN